MTYQWNPLQYLKSESDDKLALVMLNQPLPTDRKMFTVLWNKALLKVAVDGGANHLYNTHVHNREKYLPDLITGDFDSIQPEVKSYYEEQNVEVVATPDQNFTDFTKALKVASDKIKEKEIKVVIVLGSFGGRLDHMFANINSVYEASEITDAQIILLSVDTVAFLLQPGHHSISVDPRACGEWCGLIPVGEPCNSVTTTGLKWNLDKQRLKFGDLISTSNTLESESTDVVIVETDAALLWTMGIIPEKEEDIVYQMAEGVTDEDILKRAWMTVNSDIDDYYPEDQEDFIETFTLHGDVEPLHRYCDPQREALLTEIFKSNDNKVYVCYEGCMTDLEPEQLIKGSLLVKSPELTDQILTPLKILEKMKKGYENGSTYDMLKRSGDHIFIEDIEIFNLSNGDILIDITCGS
ncbi:thiamin pyrophosphokinase 1-like isoform X1 [Mytilus trossulus]|uniref:thiamin pyrophosphokinase 1-like isoform X1 n=1 Tax=Mytilus trossulus TaxID=6551 RepID=UPI003007B657